MARSFQGHYIGLCVFCVVVTKLSFDIIIIMSLESGVGCASLFEEYQGSGRDQSCTVGIENDLEGFEAEDLENIA